MRTPLNIPPQPPADNDHVAEGCSRFLELETINKLYLELSQFATAKTRRELALEDLLTSARAICNRKGNDTAWARFDAAICKEGIGSVTAKVFKVLPEDNDPS